MRIDYPRALVAGLGIAVGVAVLLAASTSGAAFGLYNPAWDGTADLRTIAEEAGATTTVARNASAYDRVPARGTVAVVLAPETPYAPTEAARLRSFVESGGTLVVADDVGRDANPLLAATGAQARLDRRTVRDEQHYYRGPALPVAGDVAAHEYTVGVDALTLNHGTAVVANGATAIVNTSDVAYLDSNGNGELDDPEPIGPFPVVTVEEVGDGRVVVVGDPSALINVMLERPGNRAFVTALFSAHERVLLDNSHAGGLPPAAYALLVLRDSAILQVALGLVAVGLIGLWATWPDVLRDRNRSGWLDRIVRSVPGGVRERPADDRGDPPTDLDGAPAVLAAHLRERHPDWEPGRIERVVSRAVRQRDGEANDRSDADRR